MRLNRDFVVVAILILGVAGGRTEPTHSVGAQQIFDANELQAATAVSNAFPFALRSNKGMTLFSAETDNFIPGWRKTNGWILFPLDGPSSTVPWKKSKELVPYIPTFHIVVQPVGTNRATVTVRTIDARVIHGKEIGIHGGWAHHEVEVSPVLSEETNVLLVISNALNSLREQRAPP
jgi:hypothetical protein